VYRRTGSPNVRKFTVRYEKSKHTLPPLLGVLRFEAKPARLVPLSASIGSNAVLDIRRPHCVARKLATRAFPEPDVP
jgi:hypothetical protein